MRLWKRASGALKDQTSIWQANLTRRTALRNPDVEKAVIRATTHHDSSFDRRLIDRACDWVHLSPYNLKPVLWSVSNRMEKTRNWIVALKGLYLMHVLVHTRSPCVKSIGRLPFDLSNFKDGHIRAAKAWPFNAFVRAYYAFLDQKSTVVFQHGEDKHQGFVMKQELLMLQQFQNLVDLLMQIKPESRAIYVPLILHVMDAVIIEIYDIYSRICRRIAIVLLNIYSAEKAEATMALNVMKKATQQWEDLMYYLEYCQEIGVVKASEFPVLDRVPEDGIQELEQIIMNFDSKRILFVDESEKGGAIVVREMEKKNRVNEGNNFSELKTIITDKWEKFDDDFAVKNPFVSPMNTHGSNRIDQLPDLIIFL